MKSVDEYNEATELTPEQKKAFASLKRAWNKCIKEKIYFHQVLGSLEAYNGNNIEDIDDTENPENISLNSMSITSFMRITDAWADDEHYVHLKD